LGDHKETSGSFKERNKTKNSVASLGAHQSDLKIGGIQNKKSGTITCPAFEFISD